MYCARCGLRLPEDARFCAKCGRGLANQLRCPRCGSIQVHEETQGRSLLTGFIGSGKITLTCLKCGHQFNPGGKKQSSRVAVGCLVIFICFFGFLLLHHFSSLFDSLEDKIFNTPQRSTQPAPPPTPQDLESLRISLAQELEDAELKDGVDMTVRAEGPKHTTLRLTYTLMSQPLEYQFVHNERFMTSLRGARFKKLVFANDLSTSPYYRTYKLE